MFNTLRGLLGNILVEEVGDNIVIKGLPAKGISEDMYEYWRTNKIAKFIFIKYSSYEVVFPKFFAVEFMYMTQELMHRKGRRAPSSAYNKIIKGLLEHTWLKNLENEHMSIMDSGRLGLFHKKPLKHQYDFFALYDKVIPQYNLKGYVLALDTGAGKTLTSLMTSEQLKADHIVTICPNRAVYNVWRKAYEVEYKSPVANWVSQDGLPLPQVNKAPKGIVIHYEYMEKAFDWLVQLVQTGKRVALIVDESHNFNEMAAQRTRSLIALCHKVKFITTLWLSATPIKALGSEMIPMLNTIDPLMNPDVSERFRQIFGKNATKGIDILKNRMGLISYVVKIEKSNPITFQLPITVPNPKPFLLETIKADMIAFITERTEYYRKNFKMFETIYYDGINYFKKTLSSSEKKEFDVYVSYFNMIKNGYDPKLMIEEAKFCNQYEEKVIAPRLPQKDRAAWKNSKSVIKYVNLKIQGECLGTIVGKRRAEAVAALIPHVGMETIIENSVKKVVIFSSYIIGVTETLKYLESKGIDALYVDGSNSKNVAGIVNEFGRNPKYKVLVTTYQSLSSAMPLTMANTIITLNVPFRDHDYQQAVGRIDRIDQDTQTEVYNAVLDTGNKPNISTRSFDILAWSKEMVEGIMGTSDEHYVEISIEALKDILDYNELKKTNPDDVEITNGVLYKKENVKTSEMGDENHPQKDKTKEVDVASLSQTGNLSEMVARILLEALSRDDLKLIHTEEECQNDILKDIRIVTKDHINDNLNKTLSDSKESMKILVVGMKEAKTLNEKVFMNQMLNAGIETYGSVEELASSYDLESGGDPILELIAYDNTSIVEGGDEEIVHPPIIQEPETNEAVSNEDFESGSEPFSSVDMGTTDDDDLFKDAFGTEQGNRQERQPQVKREGTTKEGNTSKQPIRTSHKVGELLNISGKPSEILFVDECKVLVKDSEGEYFLIDIDSEEINNVS